MLFRSGVDFVMTALFIVLFVNQWLDTKEHRPALIGVGCSLICLLLFGADRFIVPAMLSILAILSIFRKTLDKEDELHADS